MRIGLLRVTKHIRTKEINVGKMLVFFFMRYWSLWDSRKTILLYLEMHFVNKLTRFLILKFYSKFDWIKNTKKLVKQISVYVCGNIFSDDYIVTVINQQRINSYLGK